ncbi:MAG TPA: hypothetical protein VKV21_02610 [Solirubrobacteraceae bacterium]|nr:hypothetical protein [Solirubrobacteraceae bacterium]
MIRQRVRLRRFGVAEALMRLLVSLLALAAIWYGAMVILAAIKVSPDTINGISAYRTVYHVLIAIDARSITGRDRIIVAAAGVLCLLVFAPAAWRALPRPYLARTGIALGDESGPGVTELAPRALERTAEVAATAHPRVRQAAARYGSGTVDVHVELSDDDDLTGTLRSIQHHVRERLREHGVPDGPVDVTFAGLST